MRIFLDTANVEQIRQAARLGIVSGVTTNPSLMYKEGRCDYKEAIQEICSIISGPVSVEVVSTETPQMLQEAREMAQWAPNVVIKIPATVNGLEITSTLAKESVKVNMTLCFTLNQAVLAALAGAAYISPFVGRLDDIGHDGMELVSDIVEVYNYYEFNTEVIAASIRHPQHCTTAAKIGAHIATVPYSVLMMMMQHPLTDTGIERFMADWQKVSKSLKTEKGR
jgi:transaldolase